MLCGSGEGVEGVAVQALSVFGHCITDKLQQSTSFLQQLVNSVLLQLHMYAGTYHNTGHCGPTTTRRWSHWRCRLMPGAGVLVSSITRPVKTDGVSQSIFNGPLTYFSRHKMCG